MEHNHTMVADKQDIHVSPDGKVVALHENWLGAHQENVVA